MVRPLLALAVLLSLAVAPDVARAQEPSESEMAAARELFQSGLEHARAGRWDDARADFERSWSIAQVPTTLLNLAGAQAESGQLVAALESYREFLPLATGRRAARYRVQAEEALAALEARVPKLELSIDGLQEGDVITVDGDEISQAIVGVPLPVDPGPHEVVVTRSGAEVGRGEITLSEGGTQPLVVELRAPDPGAAIAPETVAAAAAGDPTGAERMTGDPDDDAEGGGVASSPWLWTGVGAVVLAGVLAAIIATRGGDSPYRGNFGDGREIFE